MANGKRILILIALGLIAQSAAALNNRSAVSINGLDTNACTVAAPCRTFTTALFATAPDGEVVALDSAGYGPFAIGQNVSVSGAPGIHAAITASSGTAIDIIAGTDVYISNLTILGTGGGVNGIRNTACTFVHVNECLIKGFSGSGILNQGTSALHLVVDHTTVNLCGTGINLDGGLGAIDNCAIHECSTAGVGVYNNTYALPTGYEVTIVTMTTFRWNGVGLNISSDGSTHGVSVRVYQCSFSGDGYGVKIAGTNGALAVVNLFASFIESVYGSGNYEMASPGNNYIHLEQATLTPYPLQ